MLAYLNQNESIENSEIFAEKNGFSKEDLEPVLKSLLAEDYIKLGIIERR